MLWLLAIGPTRLDAQIRPPGCTGSGLGINLFTSSADVHIGDTLTYSVTVFNGLAGTGRIVCDASEIVAGIVTPDGVTNLITLRRTSLSNGEFDYYTNVVSYVVRAQDLRSDGTVRTTAFDDGNIHQNDTNSRGGGDQGVNTEVNLPCVALSALCFGGVGEGGLIRFTGSITNCGNTALVGVSVTNFVNGGGQHVTFITNLAIGQVATFSGGWVPSNPCGPNSAVLTVTAVDQFTSAPRTVTSSATLVCENTLTPGILVTKSCPTGPVAPGRLLTFTGTVANTGDVTLTNVVVLNSRPGPATPVFTIASLAPGQTVPFSGSYLAPTNCSVSDTLTATGVSPCGAIATHSATATCDLLTTPALVVSASCPTGPVLPGGLLRYSGRVLNSGDVTLTNVTVTADRPAANTPVFTIASLAPGEGADFTGTYTVGTNVCTTSTSLEAGGRDACNLATATHRAVLTCPVATAPALVVVVECPVTNATAGGPIVFRGSVRNSGDITLVDVTVVHTQNGTNVLARAATLAPGGVMTFLAGFNAPVDACSVATTVVASGTDACLGAPVTGSASVRCELVTHPSIEVTQACPAQPPIPGSSFVFAGTVRNSGDVTLTNVTVRNSLVGSSPVFSAATLAPGAVASFSVRTTSPTNCTVTATSTATAASACGIEVTHATTTTCAVATTPGLTVVQACPTLAPVPGGLLLFTGTVRNSGDTTLSNVVVRNSGVGPTPVLTLASLAPGASASYSGSFRVPLDCCTVSSTATASGIDACSGLPTSDTSTTTCVVGSTPAVEVTKTCPTTAVPAGAQFRYTGTVRNSGDITLVGVVVFNDRSPGGNPVFGPTSLAPGESAAFTGSYVNDPDYCGTDTLTARGTSTCGTAVTGSVTTTCLAPATSPAILVALGCPTLPTPRGGIHTFTGTVWNIGDVTLTNVFVHNSQPTNGTPVLGPITLAPGASATFTGSFTAPLDCCEITETVTATGRDRCAGTTVSARSTSVCPMATYPAISISQACGTGSLFGDPSAFSGLITNNGDVNLTNVMVHGIRDGNVRVAVFGPVELAPGETARFSGNHPPATGTNTAGGLLEASGQDTCLARTVLARVDCSGPVRLPPSPDVRSATQAGGVVTLVWDSSPGTTYTLQCKASFEDPIWIDIPGVVIATGETATKSDVLGPTPRRFYRVILTP